MVRLCKFAFLPGLFPKGLPRGALLDAEHFSSASQAASYVKALHLKSWISSKGTGRSIIAEEKNNFHYFSNVRLIR